MKLITLFITIACLQVSASSFGQWVTLSEQNAPLSEVLNSIQRQSGYQFFYKGELLGNAKVTIQVKDVTVQQALDIALKDLPLSYTITNNIIVIKKKESAVENPMASLTPKDVTGQVTNKQGVPLVSATVLIKRTKSGTLTDVKGNFTLRGVTSDDILLISYIGYNTAAITVGDRTVFNISLEETKNTLDQVVIQAYGQTSQRLNTGDIATVTAKEIEDQPVMNPLAALEGKVPGLSVQQTNGYASSPFKVEIRGRADINPNFPSEPLYVIDGVPLTVLELNGGNYASGSTGFAQNGLTGPAGGQSPIFSINPNDIESISVLKDAAATAIYGSRGANGVIIITTKKGAAGKTKLDVNTYEGVEKVTQQYSMLNTQQYIEMRKEAFRNDGINYTDPNNAGIAYDLQDWNTSSNTNWQKYLWGNSGNAKDAQLSLSGGDKQTTFRIGGGFHRETDITTANGANERASVQFNLTHHSLDQKLLISFTNTYSYSKINIISLPGDVALPPDAPSAYLSNGQLNWTPWELAGGNPFGSLLQPYTSTTGFLNSNLTIQYELIKGLNFSTALGYSSAHQGQISLTPISSQDPANNPKGSVVYGNNNNTNSIIEPKLEYKTFIDKGKLDAFLGGSIQSVDQDGNEIFGSNYLNDNLLQSISNAPTRTATNVSGEYRYAALFGQINYNWEDKYIIDLSARRDGSSKFGPGHQFGNFGAASGAYIFTEEAWIKQNMPFLSFGKIRGSYGITGSDNIGNYGYLSQWITTSVTYQPGQPSYLSSNLPNPNLQWQVNKKLEGAVDLGLLKDRLTVELSWYRNIVDHQLVTYPLPAITGFGEVTANSPAKVQNTGIESTIRYKAIDGKDFTWSFNFDIGANRNKLLAFPNLASSPYAGQYVIGQPLNIVHLLHYTGVDPQTGQYTFEDKNHDGYININPNSPNNDLYTYNLNIKDEGGFGTDLRYKDFELNLFFYFRQLPMEQSNIASIGFPGAAQNFPTEILNRWQKPGDVAQFARFTTQPQASDDNFYYYSDGTYSNGSYIRLQNASLSYNLPQNLIRRLGISKTLIFVRGENLFLITKYKGVDPATPTYGELPPQKTIIAGFQVTF